MTDLSESLGKAVVPVAVRGGFALARKYVKPSARLSEMQLSALDVCFRQTQWIVGISVVAVGVVFVWATHYVLVSLNNLSRLVMAHAHRFGCGRRLLFGGSSPDSERFSQSARLNTTVFTRAIRNRFADSPFRLLTGL